MTRGLLDARIQVLAGIDIDQRLAATYEPNNAPSRFICEDVRSLDLRSLRQRLGIRRTDCVLYAACTPCQPFSTLSRMAGRDPRKSLLLSFGALLAESPPDLLLIENVPGLNSAYGREIYEEFARIIRELGFATQHAALLDAKDFAVPQVRRRFILLASRHGKINEPRRASRLVTVRDAIAHYPRLRDGQSSDAVPNHVSRRLLPHHRVILRAIPKNGGSRKDVADSSILLKCHREHPNVHKDVFGRMAWDGQAPTLTGRCTDVYNGRFAHPEQDRGISLREAAALQSFRDNYEFCGTYFHIAQQIGNAVPVSLARHLGESLQDSV